MKLNRNFKLLIIVLLISSCTMISPTYKQPQVAMPNTTRSGIYIESSTQNLSQVQWWLKLKDPILNQLIEKALINNNQLLAAKSNILQAQAKLKVAQYSWIPTLNLNGEGFMGSTWASNLSPQGSLTQSLPSGNISNGNFNGYYGGFVPNYSLNIFNNISQTKLAMASLDQQKAYLSAIRLSIISQVSGSYFMLLGLKEQLKLQTQLIADLKAMQQLEINRFNNGKSDSVTVYNINKQIDLNQAKLPLIENSIAQTENAIRLLLNQNPGSIPTLTQINDINIVGIIPANLPSGVLKSRPDIIIATDNLKIANANIGLAQAMFFPTINLTGALGGISVALSNLFNLSSGFWAIQAAASMPILNASSFAEVKAAKNGYYVVYYNYMQTVKAAFADVDNNLTNQQKLDKMYEETTKYVKDTNDIYQVSLNKYNVGTSDYLNVLSKKVDLDNAWLSLNQAKMQQLNSIVNVYQALAGGYNAK